MSETVVMNANVAVATVEDWMSNELVRFEGENSSWEAIQWKEQQAEAYAINDNGRAIDIDSEEYEERYEGQSEDLYVIGYDVDGNQVGVQFG
ncbi:hypothetical protein [Vagococcus fluvialis]|uniref:hypothetical protein n=1 Tax=Vagococcus fluvialis TaxID=2738 RepID=UPI001D0AF7DB|nr:hypothetical protein [Vagococcus fluvialis]UDM72767.1 hypothetical protein K5L00_14530 [Vagococcus fluvialis]UDM78323.1 hypothetical protein K5K98_14735 [Vagococcus fluvialis]UDM84042.1 hypothetical protein K5K96_14555 [Vagococcus fluvialis]